MHVLIACDSFKDALDAHSVCSSIERGLQRSSSSLQTRICPLSDGGEGMVAVLRFHLGLQPRTVTVCDPLFRKIPAQYNVSPDGTVAFIEMAQAAGLPLLQTEARNPLHTTTFGVGELIQDALSQGARRIVLGIGGSATNDLGIGMAAALGWQFFDAAGLPVRPVGGQLGQIRQVVPPALPVYKDVVFEAICDVQNPLTGPQGAARTYARQKGASEADIAQLEQGALDFTSLLSTPTSDIRHPKSDIVEGLPIGDRQHSMFGAAGGLGFGLHYFLGARLRPGIETMMDLIDFDRQLAWADVIITGEGRIDAQTAQGKLVAGIVTRARPKKVIAFCGALAASPAELDALGVWAAFSIAQGPGTLETALAATASHLESTAFQVGRLL